jgi:hypothetical protein
MRWTRSMMRAHRPPSARVPPNAKRSLYDSNHRKLTSFDAPDRVRAARAADEHGPIAISGAIV